MFLAIVICEDQVAVSKNVIKRTDGLAAQYAGVFAKIRFIALKSRALTQYGGGRGGVLSIKKDFGKPPC